MQRFSLSFMYENSYLLTLRSSPGGTPYNQEGEAPERGVCACSRIAFSTWFCFKQPEKQIGGGENPVRKRLQGTKGCRLYKTRRPTNMHVHRYNTQSVLDHGRFYVFYAETGSYIVQGHVCVGMVIPPLPAPTPRSGPSLRSGAPGR